MDSNTDSIRPFGGQPDSRWDGLAALAEVVDGLAAQDLDGLADSVRAERVLVLRRMVDRLEGHWLKELAAVDARGAAGADQDDRLGRPRRGCGIGCAWVPARPRVSSARPEPCSAAP